MSVESAVAKLQVQQEAMAEDVRDMKSALNSIASSLEKLSILEQRQSTSHQDIDRAHKRLDSIESLLKEEVKGHEKRIQSIEINQAKNQWIERVIMAVIMGVIGLWIKGGV
jgi:multidrug resistance efflux pump